MNLARSRSCREDVPGKASAATVQYRRVPLSLRCQGLHVFAKRSWSEYNRVCDMRDLLETKGKCTRSDGVEPSCVVCPRLHSPLLFHSSDTQMLIPQTLASCICSSCLPATPSYRTDLYGLSTKQQQLVNLCWSSDCVNVHVDAAWTAFIMKARSPVKVMEKMALCPAT